jgi:hypothetical protein
MKSNRSLYPLDEALDLPSADVTDGLSARANTGRQIAVGTHDEHASADHSWNPYYSKRRASMGSSLLARQAG